VGASAQALCRWPRRSERCSRRRQGAGARGEAGSGAAVGECAAPSDAGTGRLGAEASGARRERASSWPRSRRAQDGGSAERWAALARVARGAGSAQAEVGTSGRHRSEARLERSWLGQSKTPGVGWRRRAHRRRGTNPGVVRAGAEVLGAVQGDASRDGSARRRRAAALEWARRALEARLTARARVVRPGWSNSVCRCWWRWPWPERRERAPS
jgi:hypothetical protein